MIKKNYFYSASIDLAGTQQQLVPITVDPCLYKRILSAVALNNRVFVLLES